MRGREVPLQFSEDDRKRAILYHGTKRNIEEFRTPTGLEKMDVTQGGVIYFTSDIQTAKRYAGPNGYVCVAEVDEPVPYREQLTSQGLPPKQTRFTRNVFIALPTQARIKELISVKDL